VKARGEGQKGAAREGGGARRGTASRDAPYGRKGHRRYEAEGGEA
jgi:hypothetical protein